MEITVKPISEELIDDFLYYFDEVGFADNPEWSVCYCHYYHYNGNNKKWGKRTGEQNRNASIELIKSGKMQGFLAYSNGKPIGWCNVNSRENFAKTFSDDGCLFKLGCLGPNTFADCTLRYWNSRTNSCISSGAPCIGCASETFASKSAFPFYRKGEMQAEKETTLHEIDLRFEAVLAKFNERIDDGNFADAEALNGMIAGLEIQHRRISAIPTWPWRPEVARIVLTAIASPLILMIVQYFVFQALSR